MVFINKSSTLTKDMSRATPAISSRHWANVYTGRDSSGEHELMRFKSTNTANLYVNFTRVYNEHSGTYLWTFMKYKMSNNVEHRHITRVLSTGAMDSAHTSSLDEIYWTLIAQESSTLTKDMSKTASATYTRTDFILEITAILSAHEQDYPYINAYLSACRNPVAELNRIAANLQHTWEEFPIQGETLHQYCRDMLYELDECYTQYVEVN